ncbi:MAG: energy transducer TonB [Pseudomonadota bacterium]
MVSVDKQHLSTRGLAAGLGPRIAAVGLSMGLHFAAMASFAQFGEVDAPKPYAVFAVDLVHRVEPVGAEKKDFEEESIPDGGSKSVSNDIMEREPDPIRSENREMFIEVLRAPEPKIEQERSTAEEETQPARKASSQAARDIVENRKSLVSSALQQPQAKLEHAAAPRPSREGLEIVPPVPSRKPPDQRPTMQAEVQQSSTVGDVGRTAESAHHLAEQATALAGASDTIERSSTMGETVSRHSFEHHGLRSFPTAAGENGSPHSSNTGPEVQPSYSSTGGGNAPPRYPYLARRLGQEGRVVLRVEVTAAGAAATIKIYRSSGFHLLDEAAMKAVGSWQFTPAYRQGSPVAGSVDVPVAFRLTE